MFTDLGTKRMKEATEYKMGNYYDPYMGNFGFTENQLFECMNEVLMWLESHEDYVLICQNIEDYEGRIWYLTPQNTL